VNNHHGSRSAGSHSLLAETGNHNGPILTAQSVHGPRLPCCVTATCTLMDMEAAASFPDPIFLPIVSILSLTAPLARAPK
jgi:hypothetical protein